MTELSQNAYAARVGVSQPRVAQWLAAGMPRAPSGKVDAEAADSWLANHRRESAARQSKLDSERAAVHAIQAGKAPPNAGPEAFKQATGATLADAIRVKEISRAKQEAMKAAVMEGNLLPRAEVEQYSAAAVLGFRAAIESLPGRLCSDLAGISDAALIKARIQAEVHSILETFSRRLRAMTESTGRG